jgi:hypothetical protein
MRCSFGVPVFLALSCLPLHAQEQAPSPRLWLEIGQGIVCDTPEQIERFVALRGDGRDVAVALRTVNNESHNSACDFALIAFTDSKPIVARVIQGRLAAIVQIMVHAVGYGGATWRTMPAHARYTVEVEEGQIT